EDVPEEDPYHLLDYDEEEDPEIDIEEEEPEEDPGDQTPSPRDESSDSEFKAEEADDELKVEEAMMSLRPREAESETKMVRKGAVLKPPSDDEGSDRPRKTSKKSDGDEGPSDPHGPLM
nr:hypothetical protein [Tanacetum cinerariifolium]